MFPSASRCDGVEWYSGILGAVRMDVLGFLGDGVRADELAARFILKTTAIVGGLEMSLRVETAFKQPCIENMLCVVVMNIRRCMAESQPLYRTLVVMLSSSNSPDCAIWRLFSAA